jgi:glycosyltransferase involved in cell wall biosynthesis
MKVINAMFGKGMGGIEQSFLDYNHALIHQRVKCYPFVHARSAVRKLMQIPYFKISNFSKFDPLAVLKLRKLTRELDPNFIITHGNRAIRLMTVAKPFAPVIAVCHNRKLKYNANISYVFAVAKHLKKYLKQIGYEDAQIKHVPNMLNLNYDTKFDPSPITRDPLRIGILNRLVPEKRVDVLINATSLLIKNNIPIVLYIAGIGSEAKMLKKLCSELGILENVVFLDWVTDKRAFFDKIDIFVLTSEIETFGIVLLEAMAHSKLIVATKTFGACEVLNKGEFGFLVSINDPKDLAAQIESIYKSKEDYFELREKAFISSSGYSVLNVSRKLINVLEEISFNRLNL